MSLDEIPNQITVSLGRRGFDPIHPKQCLKCGNPNQSRLKLLEKIEQDKVTHEKGEKRTIDYKIQCLNCQDIFYIRLQHLIHYQDDEEKRVTTKVNILDENKNDLGWLGNY
ncbi:MAG: hypothetical protein ACFFDN_07875 [Candidatus Hodarchaeota archaeon]